MTEKGQFFFLLVFTLCYSIYLLEVFCVGLMMCFQILSVPIARRVDWMRASKRE